MKRDPLLFYAWSTCAFHAAILYIVFTLLLFTDAWMWSLLPYAVSAVLAVLAKKAYLLWARGVQPLNVVIHWAFSAGLHA